MNHLIRIPDRYPLYLNTRIKTKRIIKPNIKPLQVYNDMWLPYLTKDYISNCLRENVRRTNLVTRDILYITTQDSITHKVEEGFVIVPKYTPRYLQKKDENPRIYFLYKVNNHGLFYFK